MKHLIYLFLCLPTILSAQQVFSFEEGNLNDWIQTPSGRWSISEEEAISDKFSLHHSFDNSESAVDCIALHLMQADTDGVLSWLFRIKHSYNPSSANNWQLFVLADDFTLEKECESDAIVFGVNYNCSDDLVKLWQCVKGDLVELAASEFNYQEAYDSDEAAVFLLERFPEGDWHISYFMEESNGMVDIGSGFEQEVLNGCYMGFRYSYSSAQDRKLWIDDLVVAGNFFADTFAPQVVNSVSVGLDAVEIEFQEEVFLSDSSTFYWQGLGPDSIHVEAELIRLHFAKSFPNRSVQDMRIKNIIDLSGNILSDTTIQFYRDQAEFGDLVINEILQDPQPVVYLPAFEYVELFNRHKEPICMDGWVIEVNGKKCVIDSLEIAPAEYLVLTHVDGSKYFREGLVKALFTSSTLLSNGGGKLSIYDKFGRMIHTMRYESLDRYDADRGEGGWSIEQRDPDNLCGSYENWGISEAWKGGTPGSLNSINSTVEDRLIPLFQYLGIEDSTTLALYMNEDILLLSEEEPKVFLNDQLLQSNFTRPYASSRLAFEMEGSGHDRNTLFVESVSDCAGNKSSSLELSFSSSVIPKVSNVLLNEIMYDPEEGGVEYLELKNVSDHVIDLRDLQIGLSEEYANDVYTKEIRSHSHLFFPGEIIVLSPNSRALRSEWDIPETSLIVEMLEWKALPANATWVYIFNRSNEIIDCVRYSDEMHHDYLGISRGVSLERVQDHGLSNDNSNWSSASFISNYGTPGMENSQSIETEVQNEICISPKVFSPDNDAVEDFLHIEIPTEYWEGRVTIFVSTLHGIICRELVQNGLVGFGDTFVWDGEDNDGLIVQPGLYVIHIILSKEGKQSYKKEVCAVRYR